MFTLRTVFAEGVQEVGRSGEFDTSHHSDRLGTLRLTKMKIGIQMGCFSKVDTSESLVKMKILFIIQESCFAW